MTSRISLLLFMAVQVALPPTTLAEETTSVRPPAEYHLHPGRRPGLRRPRLLRPATHQDALHRSVAEGMRFTDCYAGSTVCAPSRCSLMTGLHMGHAWVVARRPEPLQAEDVTVAAVFKTAGYATGVVGKWGLGGETTRGLPAGRASTSSSAISTRATPTTTIPTTSGEMREVPLRNEVRHVIPAKRLSSRNRHEAGRVLARLVHRRGADFARPARQRAVLPLPGLYDPAREQRGGAGRAAGMEVPDYGHTDKDWPEPQKGHAAMISRMDADVGRLMERLSKLGIDDNTMVIFTSDNGPHWKGGADPDFFDSPMGCADSSVRVRRRHPRADDRPLAGPCTGR